MRSPSNEDQEIESDTNVMLDCSPRLHSDCFPDPDGAPEHELESSFNMLNSHSRTNTKAAPSGRSFPLCYIGRTNKSFVRLTLQIKVYNFLERPTGWKCFVYHFSV